MNKKTYLKITALVIAALLWLYVRYILGIR